MLLRRTRRLRNYPLRLSAPNGQTHKVEILADGQQIVVDGIHPDTGQPYRWHGGEPGPQLRRQDLPLLTAEKAAAILAAATDLLVKRGWTPNKKTNGVGKRTVAALPNNGSIQVASAPTPRRRSMAAPRSWPQDRRAAAMMRSTSMRSGSAP